MTATDNSSHKTTTIKNNMKEILTIQDVCRELGISTMTVLRLRQQCILQPYQFAEGRRRTVYFLRSELLEALKKVDGDGNFLKQ